MTAPAVFEFLGEACPDRHLKAAEFLGANAVNAKRDDAGKILADTVRSFMSNLNVENGLENLGFSLADVEKLVEGTLPQERVNKMAPKSQCNEDIAKMFEASMQAY